MKYLLSFSHWMHIDLNQIVIQSPDLYKILLLKLKLYFILLTQLISKMHIELTYFKCSKMFLLTATKCKTTVL